MKAFLDCVPCAVRQALETVRRVTDDTPTHLAVLKEVCRRLADVHLDQTPAALSRVAYQVVEEVTGEADPYAREKRMHNERMLALVDHLETLLDEADNRLHRALTLAVAGNVIDLGIGRAFDIDRAIETVLDRGFARDDSGDLEAELATGRRKVLYMLDNAGEIVFDRLLIEQLADHDVTACVRGGPIINDATLVDAEQVGLTERCPVITTGSNAVGVAWAEASDELRVAWAEADIIIAKGQANFETLTDTPGNRYLILMAKCQCVAQELGVELGDVVIVHKPAAS